MRRRSFIKKSVTVVGSAVICTFGFAAEADEPAPTAPEETIMPHISVKMFPGRSKEQKERLAEAIVQDVASILNASRGSISVSIEDVSTQDWKDQVYDPEVLGKRQFLFKKPDYSM